MILSLDTNVLIDIVNDQGRARECYDEAVRRGDEIIASSVAAHEFHFGCLISPRPDHHLARARALLADMAVADWSFDDGVSTAQLRRTLRQDGTPIGAYDVMIAGQALARGWTVVTANISEFTRVASLEVVNWRSPTRRPGSA